jgi:predicted phosphodiesterase
MDTMKGFVHELDCHDRPIEVVPIADLHIGDPASKENVIKSLIDGVANNENRYAILVGDLMNTAIAGSKSDFYNEAIKPSEQLQRCYELLSPIKDKVLGVVSGNHEERIGKSLGVDMTRVLATELGIQSLYSDTSALIFLRFGCRKDKKRPMNYSIYVNHGHGGGRKPGGKINGLADFGSIIDADCFIIGHTHLPASYKDQSFHVIPQSGTAVLKERLFVNTASALGYTGYGNRNGYQPASNSYPIITFDNEIQHMTVTL